ncbi:MAG: signal peptidase I [Clostridia bacterium]|nr:signal peptidase I [Clostridia bacterium]
MVSKKKQLIKRILLFVLISIVLGFGLYNLNARTLLNDQMPMPLGIGVGMVMSGSMEPELSVDDVIVVVKDNDIELGDTVVYQSGGILVVHKVVGIDGDQITTRGTANNKDDDPISAEKIKGRVILSIGGAGTIIRIIRSPLVSVSILLLAIYLLYCSYTDEKKQKDEKDEKIEEIRKEIERIKKRTDNTNKK